MSINDATEHSTKNDIPFWYQDPNILFNKEFISEFFPLTDMTFNQKLNALSRTIIFSTVIVFAFSRSIASLLASFVTLFAIYVLFSNQKEGFSFDDEYDDNNPTFDYIKQNNISITEDVFQNPTAKNPFSNALIADDSTRKPAPPITRESVKNDILTQAKILVKEANPGQPDITDKLFKDLNDKLGFEQSLRPFHSNANNTIPNDQGAFADFCYGSMNSCKSGNHFSCAKQMSFKPNV